MKGHLPIRPTPLERKYWQVNPNSTLGFYTCKQQCSKPDLSFCATGENFGRIKRSARLKKSLSNPDNSAQ
jgi:hypothetical protein